MKKLVMFFLLIASFASSAWAQSEKEKVETALRNYVDAFYNADTTLIYRCMAKDVVKMGYALSKQSNTYERYPDSFNEMVSSIKKYGKYPKQTYKTIEVFEVLDQTASAKLTAGWGIDYVLLAKQNGAWMITHVLWQTHPPKN